MEQIIIYYSTSTGETLSNIYEFFTVVFIYLLILRIQFEVQNKEMSKHLQ